MSNLNGNSKSDVLRYPEDSSKFSVLKSRSENSSRSLRSKSTRNSAEVHGSRVSIFKEHGGLGRRYYDKLGHELDRILQVDIVSSITETKGSVRGRSIKLALEMKDRGVTENDIIVIYSRNHADQTIAVLSTLFLGAIVAPLDPEISHKECLEIVKKLKPKMCFTDSRTISQIERIVNTLNYSTDIINFGQDNPGVSQFNKLLNHKEDERFRPTFVEDAWESVAFILPTQGTTDDPKLVCLSHHNIVVQTMIFQDIFEYPEKVLSFFPLSWLLQTTLVCVCFESPTIRILPGPFTERSACKIIQDFRIGHAIFGTDWAIRLVTNVAIKDFDMTCLKCVMVGTVNTTKYDIKTLKALLPHVKFLQNYCLTETGCVAATKFKNYNVSLDKPMSVGTLSINCKIRVVDLSSKEVLGPGKFGEIYFHGDGLMLGYFKETEKTLASLDRGFFKTGDRGMYDEDGWLYVTGRIEDMIERATTSFSPLELEDVILTHPYVKDVVVIGNYKELVAVVKRKENKELSSEKLQKFISEKTTEEYKPTKIVFLDHFPRTTIGNVKKRLLRKDYLKITIHYSASLASINTS
nr:luciferin 4-monooxygenase-like isoform X1 [Leptinotarsa decemlineata]